MLSVKKQQLAPTPPTLMHASVGFLVYPRQAGTPVPDALRVELGPFHTGQTLVRLTDKQGRLYLEETYDSAATQARLLITVRDLEEGTYYFEVNDGFYHQIKEVHFYH